MIQWSPRPTPSWRQVEAGDHEDVESRAERRQGAGVEEPASVLARASTAASTASDSVDTVSTNGHADGGGRPWASTGTSSADHSAHATTSNATRRRLPPQQGRAACPGRRFPRPRSAPRGSWPRPGSASGRARRAPRNTAASATHEIAAIGEQDARERLVAIQRQVDGDDARCPSPPPRTRVGTRRGCGRSPRQLVRGTHQRAVE